MPSRNDQLFNRRKAQRKADLERRNGFKSEIKRALIVCEGEKTEPIYFKDLIGALGLTSAEVEVCGDSGAAPESVVKLGIRKLKDDSDFDLVFFVFDKDSHESYDEAVRRVSDLKRKKFIGARRSWQLLRCPALNFGSSYTSRPSEGLTLPAKASPPAGISFPT